MAAMPACRAWAGVGKGLSPICNSTTSLPWARRRLATARTSNAVSAFSPRANRLRVTPSAGAWLMRRTRYAASRRGSLLGGDGLGQGADDGGDDVLVHQLLAD